MRTNLSRTAHVGLIALVLLGVLVTSSGRSAAQDKTQPEPVLVNLLNPFGIAIQPETGLVFVATRFGIYRYDPSYSKPAAHKAVVEIDGYPDKTDTIGKGTKYEIGPLGMAFLDKDHLIVGDSSHKPGEDVVRVYAIPTKAPAPSDWIKEEASLYTLGPLKSGKDSKTGEGNFYGVAVGAGAVWVTCQGDESKGWIAKSEIKDGKPGELKLAIATKTATQVGTPMPITFTLDGKELVVGQAGEPGGDADSLLTFYDPAKGTLTKKLKTGLTDISGLAYSPKTKKLYATDIAWSKPHEGGLFELAIDGDNVKATRVVPLDKPTALAFDRDGHLYVTILGTNKSGGDKSKPTDPGTLLYFVPGL